MGIEGFRGIAGRGFVALSSGLLAVSAQAATLVAGTASIAPGATGNVSLSMVGDGISAGVQFDVEFDVGALGVPSLTGVGGATCGYQGTPTPHVTVVALDLGGNPLLSQTLCQASFSVPAPTPMGSYPLTVTNTECVDAAANPTSCTTSNGSVVVEIVLPDAVFRDSWDAGGSCTTAAWSGGESGNPVEGRPTDGDPVRRYSDPCAMKATSAGNFVRDLSPGGEAKYRARIYVYTGIAGSGEAVFLRARDAGANDKVRVSYDTGVDAFKLYTGSDATADATVSASESRWYAVEINFSNAAPAELRYTIQGAGSAIPLANDLVISSGIAGTDVIDGVEVGWVANQAGAPTGEIVVDAFDSRRHTAIGRLCRGDANASESFSAIDTVAMANEILAGVLPDGQPDCTEDGVIDVRDRACVAKRILAAETCP